MKVYIRTLQQASDLDDSVEERLLVGDRPKHTQGPENKTPLSDRLSQRNPEELSEVSRYLSLILTTRSDGCILQLTSDEKSFAAFADALANWLEPYHNHARPPPAVVLAEAIKKEGKLGQAAKAIKTPAENGTSTNGHKRDEEAPPIVAPPESLVAYFDCESCNTQ